MISIPLRAVEYSVAFHELVHLEGIPQCDLSIVAKIGIADVSGGHYDDSHNHVRDVTEQQG
jgi:hypothetical protein